jgi:hypothetical protein
MPAARRRRRLATVLAAAIGVSAVAWAQTPAPSPGLPLLAQAAQSIGIKQCLAAVATVSDRAVQGATRQDVILDWDHGAPDARAFFSLTGLEFGDRSTAFSLTTVPEPAGGCSIMAERISAAPITCAKFAQLQMAGYVGHPLLPSITVYSNPRTPRETVTLVNSAPGCLIIRRQAEYNWRLAP